MSAAAQAETGKAMTLFTMFFCHNGHKATVKVDRERLTQMVPLFRDNPQWPRLFVAMLEGILAAPTDAEAKQKAKRMDRCKVYVGAEHFKNVAACADEVRYRFKFNVKIEREGGAEGGVK